MSPLSGPVLVPSALLTLPSALAAYEGQMGWDEAIWRFLAVLGVCWVAVSVVQAVIGPSAPGVAHPAKGSHPGDEPGSDHGPQAPAA